MQDGMVSHSDTMLEANPQNIKDGGANQKWSMDYVNQKAM